jgi:hypothetical protein
MRRRAVSAALAAALVVGLGVGCGGSDDDEPQTEGSAVAAAQVVERFRQAPGHPRLRRAPVPDAAWEQLGFGLDPPPEIQRRYGTFTIYVVKPDRSEAVGSLLRNKATQKPLQADARGIYWEYDTLARSWVAHTRYGRNVVLAWWSESEERQTDVRWERLHEMMSALARG